MISLSALLYVVLLLIVAGLVFWLLTWLIDYCSTPEPFNKIAKVLIAVVAVLLCIGALLQLLGGVQVIRP